MIQCPNCGAQNQDGTLFCDQCLVDLAGVPPAGGDPGGMPADASGSQVAPLDSAMDMPAESSSSMSMEASIEASEFSLEETMAVDAPPMDAPPGSGVGLDAPPMDAGMGSGAPPGSAVSVGFDAPPMDGGMGSGGMGGDPGFAMAPDGGAPTDPLAMEMLPGSDLDLAVTAPGGATPSQAGGMPPMSPSQIGGAPPMSPSQLGAAALMGDGGAPPLSPSKLGAPPVSPSKLGAPPVSPSKLGAPPAEPPPPMPMPPPSQTVARLSPIAMAKLVVVRGLKTAMEYPVYEGPNFIGRFDEKPVDIDITEQEDTEKPRSSRQHACITWETTGLFIEDLSSSNGTFVNRVRVSPGEKKPLRNGDYIQTGNVLFQIKV